ncbi:putative dehydrogenase [Acephala macrosclerotiorum]|nr:putative dehydrogenase [Acephala macrosclerotiorum]
MAPICVGLIGLSGAPPDKYEGVSWTPSAHLPYLIASPHYKIIALLNTSISSAKAAIQRYKLPSSVRTYENPDALAKDDEVDLVACSVRVDRHFQAVEPSLEAGKAVFVEWPLDRNLSIAKEMAALAAKSGSKTITIDEGKIGKVLSSTIFGPQGNGGETEVKNWGHAIEFITYVLGEFKLGWQSLMANRHETKNIIDPSKGGEVVERDKRNTVPDQIMFQATTEKDDIPVSIHLRGGATFPRTPTCEWRIQGSHGELRLTASSINLNVGVPNTKVEFWDGIGLDEGGKAELLEPEKDEWDVNEEKGFGFAVGNIARLYEAYRKGEWIPDFEWGVRRHQLIEEMWVRHDEELGKA